MMSRSAHVVGAAISAAAVLVACGSEPSGTVEDPRTVAIQALDEFRLDPAEVTVEVGETIRFVVTNPRELVHEFVLGPEHVQTAHEEASEHGEMHGEMHVEGQLAALELQPGETKEATVTFEEAGGSLIGCHEPGHYPEGMVGAVIAES